MRKRWVFELPYWHAQSQGSDCTNSARPSERARKWHSSNYFWLGDFPAPARRCTVLGCTRVNGLKYILVTMLSHDLWSSGILARGFNFKPGLGFCWKCLKLLKVGFLKLRPAIIKYPEKLDKVSNHDPTESLTAAPFFQNVSFAMSQQYNIVL